MSENLIHFFLLITVTYACNLQFDNEAQVYEKNSQTPSFLSINGNIDADNPNFFGIAKIKIVHETIECIGNNAIVNLVDLQELTFYNDSIEAIIPGAFKNLTGLALLNLAMNRLNKINDGVFNYLPIYRLLLSNNRIATIELGAFNNMHNLEAILLDENKITNFSPEWFFNSPQIKTIYINNNDLIEIPAHAFEYINSDRIIKQLDFSHNNIEMIDPAAFSDIEFIGELLLYNNQLKTIAVETPIKFDTLMLENNDIACLSEAFLEKVVIFRRLYISNNALNDTCMEAINSWASAQNVSLEAAQLKPQFM